MAVKQTKRENQISELERWLFICKLDKKYRIVGDQINGKTFSVAHKREDVLDVIIGFMSYEKLDAYFRGYYDATVKKFK